MQHATSPTIVYFYWAKQENPPTKDRIYLNYSFSFHLITNNMYLWRLGELERDGCNLRSDHQGILFPRGVNFIQSEKESTIVGLSNLWNLNSLLFDWNHKSLLRKEVFLKCIMYMYLVFCFIIKRKLVFCTTSRNFVDLEPVDCGL